MVIREASDLEEVLANRKVVGLFAHEPLSLRIASLSVFESRKWQDRLNAHIRECGCGTGASLALVVGFSVFLLSLRLSPVTTVLVGWSVLWAFLAAFFFGLVGKVAGLAIAKTRLKKDCRQLLDLVSN